MDGKADASEAARTNLCEKGWLHLPWRGQANRYCLGAMLTDLKQPDKIIAKTENAIWNLETEYEAEGFLEMLYFLQDAC